MPCFVWFECVYFTSDWLTSKCLCHVWFTNLRWFNSDLVCLLSCVYYTPGLHVFLCIFHIWFICCNSLRIVSGMVLCLICFMSD